MRPAVRSVSTDWTIVDALHAGDEETIGAEAEIEMHELLEAVPDHTSGNEHGDGNRDLRGNEDRTRAMRRRRSVAALAFTKIVRER